MFTSQYWGLLHHPGKFSPLHQDSQGYITLVEVCSGTKSWGFVKLNKSTLATSKTVTNVVQKLSNINKWVERLALQCHWGHCTWYIPLHLPSSWVDFSTCTTPWISLKCCRGYPLQLSCSPVNMKVGSFVMNQDWTLHLNTFFLLALGLLQQMHHSKWILIVYKAGS